MQGKREREVKGQQREEGVASKKGWEVQGKREREVKGQQREEGVASKKGGLVRGQRGTMGGRAGAQEGQGQREGGVREGAVVPPILKQAESTQICSLRKCARAPFCQRATC